MFISRDIWSRLELGSLGQPGSVNSGGSTRLGPGLSGSDSYSPFASYRVFRTASHRFGPHLNLALYVSILLLLFLLAILGEFNETGIDVPHHTGAANSNLRSESLPSNHTVTGTSPSATTSSSSTTASFWFNMVISFITWILLIQVFQWLYRASSRQGSGLPPSRIRQQETLRMMNEMLSFNRNSTALANRLRLALLQRDFTGEDFDILRALDDDSPILNGRRAARGASDESIDQLPVHRVTTDEVEESRTNEEHPPAQCNICLGPFEVGEEIRTVPCLHKFHKECIDRWLHQNNSCPICKTRATP